MKKVFSSFFAAAGVLALAGAALGAGTMADGNATLQLTGTPSFSTATLGDANLITDPAASDPLGKFAWYYRQPSVGRSNSVLGTFTSDVNQDVFAGNTHNYNIVITGAGSNGVDRLTAHVTTVLTDGASAGIASVVSTLTLTNPNSTTLTFQIFSLVDWDIPGSNVNNGPDDVASVVSNSEVRLQQIDNSAGGAGKYAQVLGVGAARYEFGTASTLKSKVSSLSANLSTAAGSTLANSAAGDNAIAVQWSITLAPGASQSVILGFSYGIDAVPAPGTAALAGLLGLAGLRRRRA